MFKGGIARGDDFRRRRRSVLRYRVVPTGGEPDDRHQGFTAVAREEPAEGTGTGSVAEHVRALGKAWDEPDAWQGSSNAAGLDMSNELWGS